MPLARCRFMGRTSNAGAAFSMAPFGCVMRLGDFFGVFTLEHQYGLVRIDLRPGFLLGEETRSVQTTSGTGTAQQSNHAQQQDHLHPLAFGLFRLGVVTHWSVPFVLARSWSVSRPLNDPCNGCDQA